MWYGVLLRSWLPVSAASGFWLKKIKISLSDLQMVFRLLFVLIDLNRE
jgi:hypothetical protein